MGKMKDIDLLLKEYDESLHSYGKTDPLVLAIRRELLSFGLEQVRESIHIMDEGYEHYCFHNQEE